MSHITRSVSSLAAIFLALVISTLIFTQSALAADFTAVDTRVNDMLNDLNLEGGTLIVTDANGSTTYQKNYGSNFDETTHVTLASASKWLTGATIMTLVEDGLIDLDAPVSNYLTYFEDRGEKSDMTVRQMLAFTSGLPESAPIVQHDPSITQQAECQYVAENVDLLFSPGTKFHYGGLQQEIAACVAEAVTGQSFRDIITERLFTPLGMTNTQIANLVNGWPSYPDFESENPLTSGGIYTPAEDLIKFSQMILNGGTYNGTEILSSSTVEAMKVDQTYDAPQSRTIWSSTAIDDWRYGLGNWTQVRDPETQEAEPEATRMLMSAGVLGSVEWVDFDPGYSAVFTIWGNPGQMTGFVNDLVNLVSEAVVTEPAANTPPVADAGPDQTLEDTDDDGVELVTLDGTGSTDTDGSIVTYSWSGPNGLLGTTSQLTTTLAVGEHSISLTVTDDQGASSSDDTVITINPAAPDPEPRPEDQKFIIGDPVVVTQNLWVRSEPSFARRTKLGFQRTGDTGTVVEGPVENQGYTWWRVDYENDPDGWTVEDGIELVQ